MLSKVQDWVRAAAVLGYEAVTYGASMVADVFVKAPLEQLYWQGPPLGGYGFWNGMPPADVCAALTRMPASFWESSMDAVVECAVLRERQFTSFYVVVSVGVYVCMLYQLVQVILFRLCVLRPMMQQQQRRPQPPVVTLLTDDDADGPCSPDGARCKKRRRHTRQNNEAAH